MALFCDVCNTLLYVDEKCTIGRCYSCDKDMPIECKDSSVKYEIPINITEYSIYDNTLPRTEKIKCKKPGCDGRVIWFDINNDRVIGFMCEECGTLGKYEVSDEFL